MQRTWTKDEDKQLRKLFPKIKSVFVAWALGRSEGAVKKRAKRLGLTKTKKYLRSLGRKA